MEDTLFLEVNSVEIFSEKQYKNKNNIDIIEDNIDKETIYQFEDIRNTFNKENTHEKFKGTGVLQITDIKTNNEFINSSHERYKKEQKAKIQELSNIDINFPYKKAQLLTDAELQLFNFMKNNLCQIDKLEIFAKVRLADIVQVDTRVTTDKKFLWKITNKHVDYLICKKDTLDIICAVELDDYTHENDAAKEKDMFIMQVLDAAGIKTIRIKTRIRAIEKNDLALVDDYINTALAPKCYYCGKKMYPKIAKKDGHRFYACEDFINCRYTVDIDTRGEKLP